MTIPELELALQEAEKVIHFYATGSTWDSRTDQGVQWLMPDIIRDRGDRARNYLATYAQAQYNTRGIT